MTVRGVGRGGREGASAVEIRVLSPSVHPSPLPRHAAPPPRAAPLAARRPSRTTARSSARGPAVSGACCVTRGARKGEVWPRRRPLLLTPRLPPRPLAAPLPPPRPVIVSRVIIGWCGARDFGATSARRGWQCVFSSAAPPRLSRRRPPRRRPSPPPRPRPPARQRTSRPTIPSNDASIAHGRGPPRVGPRLESQLPALFVAPACTHGPPRAAARPPARTAPLRIRRCAARAIWTPERVSDARLSKASLVV